MKQYITFERGCSSLDVIRFSSAKEIQAGEKMQLPSGIQQIEIKLNFI